MIDVCFFPDLSTLMDPLNDACCLPVAIAVAAAILATYRWWWLR
jgi:hypothetical protein